MTDTTTNEDFELFDDAKADFPSKFDLKDRLVLVWATGKNGTRKGENGSYPWFETNTLVISDPNDAQDWNERVFDFDKAEERETLVPSVVQHGPRLLTNFQFSSGGMCARLRNRVTADQKPATFKPMLGRINSRPNAKKGLAASWSITEPTDSDRAIAMKYADKIREISAALEKQINGANDDSSAFD